MSSIALFVKQPGSSRAKCTVSLARAFAVSLKDIGAAIADGTPIQKKLFARDDESFEERLEESLAELDALQCDWIAFQILDGEVWNPSLTFVQITRERL